LNQRALFVRKLNSLRGIDSENNVEVVDELPAEALLSAHKRSRASRISREDFETLRLLRAFGRIQDPQKRREILELVENEAAAPKDDSDDEPRSR